MKYLLAIPILITTVSINAEVITDGTLGQQINLPSPDFQITSDLGQQRSGNLFHSFQDFNLSNLEKATFSGPNSVQNILSRVTGGNPSNINGLIRSTIPNADFYFLNPYGIIFGPNAQLDVQGSFHASTADYLRLGENGRFDARNPSDSLLTVAPVTAFGFLTNLPAKISTQSSKLILPSDETLSLIAGDIHLTSDTPLTADNSLSVPTVESESILATEHGKVNLVSVASRGEITDKDNVIMQSKGGKITIENTLIEMSGHSGGEVFMQAAQLFLDNSIIRSNTYGNQDGKSINLKLTESAYLNGLNSEISVFTTSQNNAGGILIEVPYLEITGALINTGSALTGQAGDIEIYADQVKLREGAIIGSGSLYAGQSGDIKLEVEDSLSITGYVPGYRISHSIEFYNPKSMIFSVSIGTGNSGNIFINSKNLNMISGGIHVDTFGIGRGGNITINAQQASLINGAIISNANYNKGQTGIIKMNITEQLYLAGKSPFIFKTLGRTWDNTESLITSSSFGMGDGGTINIDANNITLTDSGIITTSSFATGNAGNISIQANKLQVIDNGQISTSADYAIGGNISLNILNLLYLQDGLITTSVHGGIGDGGNIDISHPQFTVLNQGQIIAQADAGHGGNIRIVAEQFITSSDSLISASSNLGIDGKVEIDSPNIDIEGFAVILPSDFIDASSLMKTPCGGQQSNFVVKSSEGSRSSPDDFLPSGLLISDNLPIKISISVKSNFRKLAFLICKNSKEISINNFPY
ncbi:MAG: filamentous hemagglutinin N-terminal domain-containing protein [Thiomargarita sp.]|nr:filamentous hemagglutinin N-terminal domain-containing protein [Thiomargarita sp.]